MRFEHAKTKKSSRNDVIENLLQTAHSEFEGLRALRKKVASSGISMDILPDDVVLKAFVLLGDHDRINISDQVAQHMNLLMDKGLIFDKDIRLLTTPALRFFAHIDHLLDELIDVSQLMEAGITSWSADDGMIDKPIIDCATQFAAFYGQNIALKIRVIGAEWLLVRPAENFWLPDWFLRVTEDCAVTIPPIRCDDGEVLIAAMTSTGQVSVKTIALSIKEAA